MTNGQIIIGSTGGTPAPATLTAGSNITITNAANSITIASSGGSGGAQAYVVFTGITTTTNQASFNVTSLTDNGTGDTTVTFTVAFSSANYVCCISGTRDNSTTQVDLVGINTVNTNRVAGSVRLFSADSNFSSAADYYTVSMACFGAQ
jgi:hypothetical protein